MIFKIEEYIFYNNFINIINKKDIVNILSDLLNDFWNR
jgi:hypothetical protein